MFFFLFQNSLSIIIIIIWRQSFFFLKLFPLWPEQTEINTLIYISVIKLQDLLSVIVESKLFFLTIHSVYQGTRFLLDVQISLPTLNSFLTALKGLIFKFIYVTTYQKQDQVLCTRKSESPSLLPLLSTIYSCYFCSLSIYTIW